MAALDGSHRARRALLVATDTYADPALTKLRAPTGDVRALADVLGDPAIGGFEVRQLLNRSTEDVKEEIEGFFEDARLNDLLLLYVSGHGVLSKTRRFYFASSTTRLNRLLATGVEDSFVIHVMQHCRARSIVFVVDCCHSGAFAKGLVPKAAPAVDLGHGLEGHGRVTLTASTELEYAYEESPEAGVKDLGAEPGSVFTRALVEGLQTGEADVNHDGFVSLDELYDYVYERVRRRARHQRPGKHGTGHGEIVVARAVGRAVLPADLRQIVEHPAPAIRVAAIGELIRARQTADGPLAAAIEHALQHAAADAEPRVARAASDALGADPPSAAAPPAGVEARAPEVDPAPAPGAAAPAASCPECGLPASLEDDFCTCGAYLRWTDEEQMSEAQPAPPSGLTQPCPSCGRENPEDVDFCPCGEFLKWTGDGPEASMIRAVRLANAGDVDGARAAYEEVIASGRRDLVPSAQLELGGVLHDAGRLDAAKDALLQALDDPRTASKAAVRLGKLLWETGDEESARAHFRQAMSTPEWTDNVASAREIGSFLSAKGDAKAARAAFRFAIETNAVDGPGMRAFNLAKTLEEHDDRQGAADAYREAVAGGDGEIAKAAAFNLGVLLAEEGDRDGAREMYRRAIDAGNFDTAESARRNLAFLDSEAP